MRYFFILSLCVLLVACNYTDRQAIEKDRFYELKENVTIKKLNEGQILQAALPISKRIYQKIRTHKQEAIALSKPETQAELYNKIGLDSTEIDYLQQIAFYTASTQIKEDKEKQIFEAYQSIDNEQLFQENFQLLTGERIVYNYPEFEKDSTGKVALNGMWSIMLNQVEIIRAIDMKKLREK